MLTVATVLRSGGDFHEEHVNALRDGIGKHLTLPHRFVCLTNMEPDCERISLSRDWPGWWSKICLFERGLFNGPVFYMDLDTVIRGNIDDLVSGHRFTALQDWLWPAQINSSVMAWDCDLSQIFGAFDADPMGIMAAYRTRERWGDQSFIRDYAPLKIERWQDRAPGRMVSFKRDCAAGVPDAASIVCFHGKPRPWVTPLWKAA